MGLLPMWSYLRIRDHDEHRAILERQGAVPGRKRTTLGGAENPHPRIPDAVQTRPRMQFRLSNTFLLWNVMEGYRGFTT